MHGLQKVSVWIFLLAVMATAALNGTKLITIAWEVWQSDQRSDSSPDAGGSSMVLSAFQR